MADIFACNNEDSISMIRWVVDQWARDEPMLDELGDPPRPNITIVKEVSAHVMDRFVEKNISPTMSETS